MSMKAITPSWPTATAAWNAWSKPWARTLWLWLDLHFPGAYGRVEEVIALRGALKDGIERQLKGKRPLAQVRRGRCGPPARRRAPVQGAGLPAESVACVIDVEGDRC